MIRALIVCVFSLSGALVCVAYEQTLDPSFDYDIARLHELKPHRRTIPMDGVRAGFNQLRLRLTISPAGEVINADAGGDREALKFWPQLHGEVTQWKFKPFEKDGKAVTAQVEEYVDLVPPERLPAKHVVAPVLQPDSQVVITLERSGCLGNCPSYTVIISTEGVIFDGQANVVAAGKHADRAEPGEVRKLAKKFVDDDFYSMDEAYEASVTDMPGYGLSISIDGHSKKILDYVGRWTGMPAVIQELEDDADALARTDRWIDGTEGIIQALRAEKFNFRTFEAQIMLKEAASRGAAITVRGFLEAGVPLTYVSHPRPQEPYMSFRFDAVGWLNAASGHPETLKVLMDSSASKNDRTDKDLALAGAARSGSVSGVRELIRYGANPNTDLTRLLVTETGGGTTLQGKGAGSILIYAAKSGNPEMVREILKYHPALEKRDREGKTAVFAAGEYNDRDEDGARVECLRLLAKAGANINARDKDGNTPLHETFLIDVEGELLKLGANVNARNNDGETPIFTTVDDEAIPLFIAHGADLTIRNKKGQTVMEAAKIHGPLREEALRKAIQKSN